KLKRCPSELTVSRAYLRVAMSGYGLWGLLRVCERSAPVWPVEVEHELCVLVYSVSGWGCHRNVIALRVRIGPPGAGDGKADSIGPRCRVGVAGVLCRTGASVPEVPRPACEGSGGSIGELHRKRGGTARPVGQKAGRRGRRSNGVLSAWQDKFSCPPCNTI